MKLCSACLLGINCRFDGKSKENEKVIELSKRETLIPVCPEQLGGLTTPREESEIRENKIITKSGKDVTSNYKLGAEETLKIAKILNIKEAIFRKKSPSCGVGMIFDGSFSGKLIKGDGITTALLKKNGIKVISEDEIE